MPRETSLNGAEGRESAAEQGRRSVSNTSPIWRRLVYSAHNEANTRAACTTGLCPIALSQHNNHIIPKCSSYRALFGCAHKHASPHGCFEFTREIAFHHLLPDTEDLIFSVYFSEVLSQFEVFTRLAFWFKMWVLLK